MSLQTLSALLATILTFVIGWSVILRDRRQRPYVTFAVFSFNLSFWHLSHFLAGTLETEHLPWFGLLIGAAIPLNAERFFRTFLADDARRPESLSRHVLIGTAAAYLLLVASLFYPLHRSMFLLLPLWAFVLLSLYYCMYLIYRRHRALGSRSESTKLTYLLYGGAATITFAATDSLPQLGVPFPPVGSVMTVIYLYFLSQSLFHYRLLDIKELLTKMVTLTALVLILSVIYGLLLAWVGPDRPGVFFFNTIVASFVILVIFDPLRTRLEDSFNRWLFAEKYEFSRRLRRLTRDLANIIAVQPLVGCLLGELERSRRLTHGSVYLADPAAANYRLAGHVGPRPLADLDGHTKRLFLELLQRGGTLTIESVERRLAEELASEQRDASVATRNILTTMNELHADVCVPLTAEGQLLGFLNLRDDRLREAYASYELALIRQVAAQAAITLRNSKIFEQLKERDRLAALGQMAAGLAHEIRNPLSAIKGAAQLLKTDLASSHPQRQIPDDPEGHSSPEFLDIIVQEVNRLDRVVSQFLGYARPDRGDRQPLNINEVVHKTVQLLRSRDGDVDLDTDLEAELPEVLGDPEQLRQVFLNLALNGFDAMDNQGTLAINTRLRREGDHWTEERTKRASSTQFVEVTFRDRGRGIDPEELPNIFIPFYTTREGGTGLGLPICQRIVENHGGFIEVQSELDQGSSFRVLLPTARAMALTGPVLQPQGSTLLEASPTALRDELTPPQVGRHILASEQDD